MKLFELVLRGLPFSQKELKNIVRTSDHMDEVEVPFNIVKKFVELCIKTSFKILIVALECYSESLKEASLKLISKNIDDFTQSGDLVIIEHTPIDLVRV